MSSIWRHIRGQAVGYAALFIALGGTGWAAVNLPANSVGSRQIRRGAVATGQLKNHSVTPIKLATGSIAAYVRDYARVSALGVITASRPRARIAYWDISTPSPSGQIVFDQNIPSSCFAVASTIAAPYATYVNAELDSGTLNQDGAVNVTMARLQSTGNTFEPPVNVAVICPQP